MIQVKNMHDALFYGYSSTPLTDWPAVQPHRVVVFTQVNNATARVMTNKKTVNPYANGKNKVNKYNYIYIALF